MNNSLCYNTFDGKVASIEFTPNGSFLIVVFFSGLVKVFDLDLEAESSNRNSILSLDDDDRKGILLTRLRSTAGMVFSTPAYSKLVGNITEENGSHIFIGMKTSCTCLAIVDVASIRLSKLKNGFLSSIDDGIKLFYCYDGRVKGLLHVSTLSFQYLQEEIPQTSSSDTVSESNNFSLYSNLDLKDYSSKYRVLTGSCLSSVNIWDVSITTKYNKQTGEPVYEDNWNFLTSFNSNGSSLSFASIVNHSTFNKYIYDNDEVLNATGVSLNKSTDGHLFNGICEVLSCSIEKDLKVNLITSTGESLLKSTNIKESSEFLFSTYNGMLFFGGKTEFFIAHYHSNSLDNEVKGIVYKSIFPLNDFGVEGGKISGNNSLKRSRHLRHIESIQATFDGNFALILCSDNSVLLYSSKDYYGFGVKSNRTIGKPSSIISSLYPDYNLKSSEEGVLYQLFQASDKYKLNVSILNYNSRKNTCNEKLKISVSWTLVSSPYDQGVITSHTICLTHPNPIHLRNIIPSIASEYFPNFDSPFPHNISVDPNCTMTFCYNSNQNICCDGCGSQKFIHWANSLVKTNPKPQKTIVQEKKNSAPTATFSLENSTTSSQVKNLTKRILKNRDDESNTSEHNSDEEYIVKKPKTLPIETNVSKNQSFINQEYNNLKLKNNELTEKNTELQSYYESKIELINQNHEADLRDKQETIDHFVRKMQARQHRELQVRRDWKNDSEKKKVIIKDLETKIESYECLIKSLIEEDLSIIKFFSSFSKKRNSLINFLSFNKLDNYSKRNNLHNLNIVKEEIIGDSNEVISVPVDSSSSNSFKIIENKFENPLMPILKSYINQEDNSEEPNYYYNNITQNLLSNLVSSFDPPLITPNDSTSSSAGSKFFCIICQDHTADTACSPCGHVCLCRHHQIQLEENNDGKKQLKCLVCQANVSSFLSIF